MLLFTQNQFSTDISVVGISSNRHPRPTLVSATSARIRVIQKAYISIL